MVMYKIIPYCSCIACLHPFQTLSGYCIESIGETLTKKHGERDGLHEWDILESISKNIVIKIYKKIGKNINLE